MKRRVPALDREALATEVADLCVANCRLFPQNQQFATHTSADDDYMHLLRLRWPIASRHTGAGFLRVVCMWLVGRYITCRHSHPVWRKGPVAASSRHRRGSRSAR